MLDQQWGVLGMAVALGEASPLTLSVGDFSYRLHALLQGTNGDINALNELGNRLFEARAWAHAAVCYEIAARDVNALGAVANLGRCEIRLGQAKLAESRARTLVYSHPQRVIGWQLLAEALAAQRKFVDAKDAMEHALQFSGGDAVLAREWAMLAALANDSVTAATGFRLACEKDTGDVSSLAHLVFFLRCLCDWRDLQTLSQQLLRAVDEQQAQIPPFNVLAEPASAAQQATCARRQAAHITQLATRYPLDSACSVPQASDRLQVGFLSRGFGHHPTSILTSALFEQWRDSQLDVHLFSTRSDDDASSRNRLVAAAHAFYELPDMPQREIATLIREKNIEILVDLDGYSRARLPEVFAYRPAPVQVNWLAYPGTTGADYMDYVIADRFVLPASMLPFFTEKVAYLPRCYQSSDPTRVVGEPPPREACGLPATGVVYACFNTSFKLNPRSVHRMLRVVLAVPGSVLWLLAPGNGAEERLREEAQRMGVAGARLVFMNKLSHHDYLARYRHADLFLDTEDYNAHTVASDALWAGCPVLTRPGETFASRVAGSLNYHLGMPEMNATDDAAFVMKAVRFGRDATYRAAQKSKLQQLRLESDVFDVRGFARDFENLLRRMAMHHRQHGSPATFSDE